MLSHSKKERLSGSQRRQKGLFPEFRVHSVSFCRQQQQLQRITNSLSIISKLFCPYARVRLVLVSLHYSENEYMKQDQLCTSHE